MRSTERFSPTGRSVDYREGYFRSTAAPQLGKISRVGQPARAPAACMSCAAFLRRPNGSKTCPGKGRFLGASPGDRSQRWRRLSPTRAGHPAPWTRSAHSAVDASGDSRGTNVGWLLNSLHASCWCGKRKHPVALHRGDSCGLTPPASATQKSDKPRYFGRWLARLAPSPRIRGLCACRYGKL